MIQVSNLTLQFGGRYLFDDVSFFVNETDKIGLIGRNGTGKSTLLKILTGQESTEKGQIITPNDFTAGYLPQDANIVSDKSIFDEAMEAKSELMKLEEKIKNTTQEISERTDYESREYLRLVEHLAEANQRWQYLGGQAIESEVEKVLLGLGFKREDFKRPLSEFSGGWQMRVALAKILLKGPDCILLDEPTNHLDIESIVWVERFLKSYPGAVIIVSHDRKFLDNVTNRTIELTSGKIYDQNMHYTDFIEFRIQQREQQQAAYKNQQKQIKQQERFIERFKSKATLATRVQSRVKQLEKLQRIELDEPELESISLDFPEAPRSSRLIAEAKNLVKSYDENLVLNKIDFAIERGDRLAFVGKNGEGKTTFSKILAGEEAYDGELEKGNNIHLGYFAQHQAQLMDPNASVFDVIDAAATGEMRKHIRSLLGAFLFSGDDVYKKVKVLSGGERSRLAIAKLLLEPINFLILDEPTNHLDMAAKDVLKQALLKYEGTLIIVSHDRDFLEGLTDKTIEFKNNTLHEYAGDITYFLEKQELESLDELNLKNKEEKEINDSKPKAAQQRREEVKRQQREENKLKKQISTIEKEIETLENQIDKLEKMFTDPDFFNDQEENKKRQIEYSRLKEELEEKMSVWEKLNLELEEIKIE